MEPGLQLFCIGRAYNQLWKTFLQDTKGLTFFLAVSAVAITVRQSAWNHCAPIASNLFASISKSRTKESIQRRQSSPLTIASPTSCQQMNGTNLKSDSQRNCPSSCSPMSLRHIGFQTILRI